jgi:hypothetical protein
MLHIIYTERIKTDGFRLCPKSIDEDLRSAVVTSQQHVLRGELQEIELHTETFGW